MLLLVEGEEKECLPKFGVLIFILAHEIKLVYSLSWKHCRCSPTFLKLTTICDVSHVISFTRPSSPLFFPQERKAWGRGRQPRVTPGVILSDFEKLVVLANGVKSCHIKEVVLYSSILVYEQVRPV